MLGINKQWKSDRTSSETIKTLLTQVNQLVSQGLRQAAIDLLEEAVSDSPNNTSLLSALGRVYLLDRQPDKAVVYLRRSLAQSNSTPVHEDEYIPEAFTDADADYIEELAGDLSSDEFSPLDEIGSEKSSNDEQREQSSGTLHLKRKSDRKVGTQTPGDSEPQITIIRRGRSKTNDSEPTASIEPNNTFPVDEPGKLGSGAEPQEPHSPEMVGAGIKLGDYAESDEEAVLRPPETPDRPKTQLGLTFDESEEPEFDESDIELAEDIYSVPDILDVDDGLEDDLDEIDPKTESNEDLPGEDFETEDFGWEDLDDFDEEASRETDDEDLTLTGIPRELRARQAAVDVLERVGWDREYLPLLESIFVESGWGAARIAIENQIERGAVPEQIVLARQVRSIWFSNEYLWTAFRMRSNAPFMQAEAVYKNFSWADALRLIRCFPSIPDEFEIEAFIEELFEEWYFNNRLRRHFQAFLKYLRYRIGASRRTLPGNLGFLFSFPLEEEWGVENPELLSEISGMRGELRELGADGGFAMPGIENKFKVLPKEAFDEDKDKK